MSEQHQEQTAPAVDHGQPSSVSGNSMVTMEQRMREQIRLLQEQRAAAMMEEVIELQRERDLALGRVKSLKKNIENLTMENALLKEAAKGDLSKKLVTIERKYLEERLLNNDLKKKLQSVNKQKGEMMLKLRKLEMETAARLTLSPAVLHNKDRSHSMTDLTADNDTVKLMTATPDSGPSRVTPTPDSATPTAKLPPNGRKTSPPLLTVSSGQCTPKLRSGTNTPQSYSPTVIPRRYKLAAAITRDASAQTDAHANADNPTPVEVFPDVSSDVIATLESAKRDIIALQHEKKCLEGDLSMMTAQHSKQKAAYKKECAVLQTESSVLKESLNAFSSWTRQKIQQFEEDMDIFKVVYSLHGSLSQEKLLLKELREKLTKAEARLVILENENTQLQDELTHTEEKYKQCKKENKRLCEKITTPPSYHSPTPQRHHSSPIAQRHNSPTAQRHVPGLRSYKSAGHAAEQSSPLLSRSSPTSPKTMFPVKVSTKKV